MKKVNMQLIADELNISKSLVSLALNDKYGVSPQMRVNVFKKAIELGFDFNYNYKNKDEFNRKKIALFCKKEQMISNNYWGDVISSIEKALSEANYKLIFLFWDDENEYDAILEKFSKSGSHGILVIDSLPYYIKKYIEATNIPVVYVDGKEYTDQIADNVRTNNYLGGYLAAEYLYSLNHRHICILGMKEFSISFKERYYGFKNYFDDKKDSKIISIVQDPMNCYKGYINKDLKKMFKSHDLPTAFFCENDDIALFLYDVCKKYNKSIPEDVSIIGFDDLINSKLLNPPLTSVKVPVEELGIKASEMMLQRINKKDSLKKSVFLSVSLSLRESVKNLRR